MKRLLVFATFLSVMFSACKTEKKDATSAVNDIKEQKIAYASFGNEITDSNAISAEEMRTKFKNLKKGDTLNIKFTSTINEVCKKKGCWMKLDLGEEQESMVRFKDYGFFMPLNADDKEVIVNGKAFVTEISIDELQHYAKDAGKSEEEIAKITEPKYTYAFEADGVLMKK
ncbi:DUF4920 domain-containing protein [Tenacibaculum sp. 1_MG-2023]|uniref:DUF4920 domain-containing protein n=1 Tax=Tenacibaculum sp. 1_MG-2023 TaxID=3062653 RepID=UPI0026E172D3|nr:DUF4920 domain-containing protein [Tenacibaculum sp. 1_MG-2023]MDO6676291.1 DUF4920 domain-containing protein [Tenacibaculum sp. 1_MG-2023]